VGEPSSRGGLTKRSHRQAAGGGQIGDGVGADYGPGERFATEIVALEPGGERAPARARRGYLGDDLTRPTRELAATIEQSGRVAADADVAVEEERSGLSALAREGIKQVALKDRGPALAG